MIKNAFRRTARRLVLRGDRGRILLKKSGRVLDPVHAWIQRGVTETPTGTDTQISQPRDIASFLVEEVSELKPGDRFEYGNQIAEIDKVLSSDGYLIKVVIDDG
jgi:hypothetical protein